MSDIKKATEFTVVRSRWARGERVDADGYLRRNILFSPRDNTQCCMGFYAEACGFMKEQISGVSTLFGICSGMGKIESEVVSTEGNLHQLYEINDNRYLDDEDRERLITEHLAARGITVRFVDE